MGGRESASQERPPPFYYKLDIYALLLPLFCKQPLAQPLNKTSFTLLNIHPSYHPKYVPPSWNYWPNLLWPVFAPRYKPLRFPLLTTICFSYHLATCTLSHFQEFEGLKVFFPPNLYFVKCCKNNFMSPSGARFIKLKTCFFVCECKGSTRCVIANFIK